MAAGKLLGLNEDQLANAISLTVVPHMRMLVSHVGALSMWKGCHAPEAGKCAVWAALLAREGMTGPSKPFEARDGLWDHLGALASPLRLPTRTDGRMVVETMMYKRFPAEGTAQPFLELTPEIRKLTKADDITSILIEMPFGVWQEIGDPPKWDPRNRETADHSLPYIVARSLIDGDIYMDSFAKEKYMDPAARRLMEVTIARPNPDSSTRSRLTVGTKTGGVLVKETFARNTPMTHDEVITKFNRACAYQHVTNDQRDRAREQWANLRAIKDIAEPMQTLAKFGQTRPLSDRTPPRVF
jgi:2-methylcitrate dehydratase